MEVLQIMQNDPTIRHHLTSLLFTHRPCSSQVAHVGRVLLGQAWALLGVLDFELQYFMKQEERSTLQEEIAWQQEKLKGVYHKIDASLDRFLDLYVQAEQAIEGGQEHQSVIDQLNKELIHLKPLKSTHEHFIHHYRRLSNILRKVQTATAKNNMANFRNSRRAVSDQGFNNGDNREIEEKFNQFFKGFINNGEEYEMLEEMIVESYLRNGEWDCANVWPDTEKRVDPQGLFRESFILREKIKQGKLEEAILWCETQRLYETHGYLLEYDLKLMHLLGLIETADSKEVLEYYMNSFKKFFECKKDEMNKLCLHMFFKINRFWDSEVTENQEFKQRIDQRYQIFNYSQQKLNRLAEEFYQHYLKQYSLSKFDSLSVIFNCSQTIMDDYLRMLKHVWGGKDKPSDKKDLTILPFSVKTAREYQYHSLFYCPITKEVHTSNEPSMLLPCGHLISENAHNRIVHENRNRRKIKCPICQKDILPDQSLRAEF